MCCFNFSLLLEFPKLCFIFISDVGCTLEAPGNLCQLSECKSAASK